MKTLKCVNLSNFIKQKILKTTQKMNKNRLIYKKNTRASRDEKFEKNWIENFRVQVSMKKDEEFH